MNPELWEALGLPPHVVAALMQASNRTPVAENAIPTDAGRETLLPPSQPFMASMDSLVNAPFAQDTLFQILGGAPEVVSAGGLTPWQEKHPGFVGTGVMGEFMKGPERVQVNETSKDNIEPTLSHEVGHALDFRHPGTGDLRYTVSDAITGWLQEKIPGGETGMGMKLKKLRIDLMDDLRTLRERAGGITAEEAIPEYAATNPREHFAETFQIALDALRDENPERALVRIEDGNGAIPGVKRMAEFLLELPLFEDHPLNKAKK